MIRLRITTDGRIRGLWDDSLALPELGPAKVWQASYVEFDQRRQLWCVRAARPRALWRRLAQLVLGRPCGEVLRRAPSRTAALAWEVKHFGAADRQ
ncbi:MAG: hypothetical protein KKI08_14855 [Armatimonadetes bacterium]|nr:hypothetical protein [Armatimonadota bacterium]